MKFFSSQFGVWFVWVSSLLGVYCTLLKLTAREPPPRNSTFGFFHSTFQISASTPREPTRKYPGVERSKHVTKNQTLRACQERRSAPTKRTHEYQMHNASNKEMNTFPYIRFKKYFSFGTWQVHVSS